MKTAKQIKEQANRLSKAICRTTSNPKTTRRECCRLFARLNAISMAEMRYLQNIDRYLCAKTGYNISKDEFYNTALPATIYTAQ